MLLSHIIPVSILLLGLPQVHADNLKAKEVQITPSPGFPALNATDLTPARLYNMTRDLVQKLLNRPTRVTQRLASRPPPHKRWVDTCREVGQLGEYDNPIYGAGYYGAISYLLYLEALSNLFQLHRPQGRGFP